MARAQQDDRMPRVAVLTPYADSDPEAQIWFKTFVNEMQTVGWTDGGNIRIDVRWAGGEIGQIQRLAKELVDLQPKVVFAMTTPSVKAVMRETRTIPIVFTQVTDPVAQGLVNSLDRPGGSVTGFTISSPKSAANWCRCSRRLHPRQACCGHLQPRDSALLQIVYERDQGCCRLLCNEGV
jgi:putative ABC transport system substrate-binding protein